MPFRDLPGVTRCYFRKGERIMKAGESLDYIHYLITGSVYRELVTEKGYESILSHKNATNVVHSLLGILSLYNKKNNNISHSDFYAYTNCTTYRIPSETCKAYLRQHPEMLEKILHSAMDEYMRVLDLFQSRREGSGGSLLSKLLLERAKITEEGLLLPRECTNIEISKILSIHKVTVSRMLRALKEEGVIERTSLGIRILQPEKLQLYADNEITLEYK